MRHMAEPQPSQYKVSRFRESGIHPFDRDEFRGQFGAAAVNDRPMAGEHPQSIPGNSSSFRHFADVSVSAMNQSVSLSW